MANHDRLCIVMMVVERTGPGSRVLPGTPAAALSRASVQVAREL
ncbi:hypothetical protein [Edaphobacter sp. HDX4]